MNQATQLPSHELEWELILHEAHDLAERTRERLRYLQQHYELTPPVLDWLKQAGIDLEDAQASRPSQHFERNL